MHDPVRTVRAIGGFGGDRPCKLRQNAWDMSTARSAIPTRVASLAALFPNATFESVGATWPERYPQHLDILIVPSTAHVADIQNVLRRLRTRPPVALHTLVILRDADANRHARVLTREGAAEVLQAPVSDAALALCVERLLARESAARGPARKQGQIVALLKAGGGVGATSLGVQIAGIACTRRPRQRRRSVLPISTFSSALAALYFDLPDALTITDCLPVGDVLEETQFADSARDAQIGRCACSRPRDS